MTDPLDIALAQVEAASAPSDSIERAGTLARRAAARGRKMIVFPEMFMGLPTADRPPAVIASEDNGRFRRQLAALAVETRLWIVTGSWEVGPDKKRAYNRVEVISPGGETVAAYRKLHLFDALSVRESDTMVPGDSLPPVVDIAGVRVGLAICYDLRFPELFRHLADQGAQLIVVPSAWYQGPMKETHWRTLLRARAIENTCFVAGCNLVGPAFCGRTSLFDPFGVCMAGAGEGAALVEASIDIQRLEEVRRKLPALAHRRRDLLPG